MKTKIIPFLNKSLINIDGEIWKDIDGYLGVYQISNFGRVKSTQRYRSDGYLLKERIMSQYKNPKGGALAIKLWDGVRTKAWTILMLVGIHFIGEKKQNEVYYHVNKLQNDNRDVNIHKGSLSECRIIDFKLGVNFNDSVANYKIDEFEKYDKEFNIYENSILVKKICTCCFKELPIINFGFSQGHYKRQCRECRLKHEGVINIGKYHIARDLAKSGLRYCTKCKELKSLDNDFGKSKHAYLGKSNKCKECVKISNALYKSVNNV